MNLLDENIPVIQRGLPRACLEIRHGRLKSLQFTAKPTSVGSKSIGIGRFCRAETRFLTAD